MNEQDLSLIERYYRNELSEAERLAFEQRMADDADFREEALLHKRAMNAISLYAKELFVKKLQDRPLVAPDPPSLIWRWIGAAVLVLAAILVINWWWWTQAPQPTPVPSVSVPISRKETTPPNIPPSQSPAVKTPPPSDRPIAQQQPDTLFAKTFRPYRDSTGGGIRGTKTQSPNANKPTGLDLLKQLALEKKYTESLEAFEQLPEGQQRKPAALFFKANSLLALDREDEAAPLFEGIASNPKTPYASHAQWYAALCALKKGDLPKAKKWLREVAAPNSNASKERRAEAEKLLERLR